jgi:hypothetical protein
MPFLVPPCEFKPGELQQLGLTGTCELQICRSAGPWSLGTLDRVEHSIQNAYLKGMGINSFMNPNAPDSRTAIQLSEHFVYIENQFFITSYAESLSPICTCGKILMDKIGRRWRMWPLRIRLAMRSSIALFVHIAKVQSGGVAWSSRFSLVSPFPLIMPMLARQVHVTVHHIGSHTNQAIRSASS